MSTELVPMDLSQLPSVSLGSDEAFDEVSRGGGDFLPRLQLYTKGKAIDEQLIAPGHYGIPVSDEEIIDLGDQIDLLPFARRTKAIDMSDPGALIVVYDFQSPEYTRIAAEANEKDSHCMYGPSFLVWERTTGQFLEFFCGSKSARSEAKKLFSYLPLTANDIQARGLVGEEPHGALPVSLKSKRVSKQRFSWHVPVVTKCTNSFVKLPSPEQVVREITKFINPSNDGPEKVEEKPGKKSRAR